MEPLITLILLTITLTATGQIFSSKAALTFYPGTNIDTEYRYTDSTGMDVIVQNSVRKGGQYIDPSGKEFFHAIYWYRVINESSAPLELTINFPADSFATVPSPDSYLKVFLPSDTMTLDKENLYAFGATGLKSFLDSGLKKSTTLQRTIAHKGACLFYIGALYYKAFAPAYAALVIRDQDVFYSIGGLEIPCGKIVFKN
ncbi:MAG TPA: hypothetical protein VD927_01660 [Chryseosolibacter sp.]|nr:hypothetical protein [Chryseosolibacter sp.]